MTADREVVRARVEVRDALAGDLGAITALETQSFGANAWSAETMAAELAAANAGAGVRSLLVATAAGRVCGYGVLSLAGDIADVHRVAVEAGRRREGVGSTLLAALVHRCASRGCRAVLLEVAADNEPALGLYGRHGFLEIARRPRYYPDGRDAVVMRLALGPGRSDGISPAPDGA